MKGLSVLHLSVVVVALLAATVHAVRPADFKKCEDSSFCRRIRRLSGFVETQSAPFKSPYYIVSSSPTFDEKQAVLTTSVKSALHPQIDFELKVHFYQDGTSRILMDQIGVRHGGWKRYDGAASWAIDQQPTPAPSGSVKVQQGEKETKIQ